MNYAPSPLPIRYLHSNLAILELRAPVHHTEVFLHSNIVLLKPTIVSYHCLSGLYLHSTIVLLKPN